jgi:hypothetical protein
MENIIMCDGENKHNFASFVKCTRPKSIMRELSSIIHSLFYCTDYYPSHHPAHHPTPPIK